MLQIANILFKKPATPFYIQAFNSLSILGKQLLAMRMSFWRAVRPSTHRLEHKTNLRATRREVGRCCHSVLSSQPTASWKLGYHGEKDKKVIRNIFPALITGESIIQLSHTPYRKLKIVFSMNIAHFFVS